MAYRSPESKNWKGRGSKLKDQYWYQNIELLDRDKVDYGLDIAIVGYVCEDGVRRNQGRIGTSMGPKLIREKLAKLPIHYSNKRIADVGDIIAVDQDMESCQREFSDVISDLISRNILPIGVGGGHDIAYANFLGIYETLKDKNSVSVGIINFDAHFDLREPTEKEGNSGTPFYQILTEFDKFPVEYLGVGIQRQSNSRELFDIASSFKNRVGYILSDDCDLSNLDVVIGKLKLFVERYTHIYITIDVDGFSSAYAPGVSAPSPLGFSPLFVAKVLSFLIKTEKVISVDFAELNPSFDIDNITANLVARMVDEVVLAIN